jgi:hypothetical protein
MVNDKPKEVESKSEYKYKTFEEIAEEINLESAEIAKTLNSRLFNLHREYKKKYKGESDQQVKDRKKKYLLALKKVFSLEETAEYSNYLQFINLKSDESLIFISYQEVYYIRLSEIDLLNSISIEIFSHFEDQTEIAQKCFSRSIPFIQRKYLNHLEICNLWFLGNKRKLITNLFKF